MMNARPKTDTSLGLLVSGQTQINLKLCSVQESIIFLVDSSKINNIFCQMNTTRSYYMNSVWMLFNKSQPRIKSVLFYGYILFTFHTIVIVYSALPPPSPWVQTMSQCELPIVSIVAAIVLLFTSSSYLYLALQFSYQKFIILFMLFCACNSMFLCLHFLWSLTNLFSQILIGLF